VDIRGGEFDDVNFTITMRPNAFENTDASISYKVMEVTNGLLFFGNNRLSRAPLQWSPCLRAAPVYLTDKDIGAFGICKLEVGKTYICTNAPNHIVTIDLNYTQFPNLAASTYLASENSCGSNCSDCNLISEVCQTTAPNTLNYWYGSYATVSIFFNLLLGLPIE
jgi:hypothetical protein